ncbi:hypothetical protein UlMin_037993 [Ulmus minor]
MRHLSRRISTLLSPSSSSSSASPLFLLLQVSHFSASSHHSSQSHSSWRRHDEESRNVRVSVWWDFENCNLPAGVNAIKVAQTITAAIRANGIKGPIEITAFGDMLQLSRTNQVTLSSTGVTLTHIPRGGKNTADRFLLIDLMCWVSQNPPPAHLFLISGDSDFASVLHRLRMNNYNILLASPESAQSILCSAASIMWRWNDLLRGENLMGKHFNQPPDGPYGSWYGHSKVPLVDPFSEIEQSTYLQIEESSEPSSDNKLRPVPKAVIKQIRKILSSYPKGISITDFRLELGKCNVDLDREYFGYKRFVPFLSSMKDILKLQSQGDGRFIVKGITPKSSEPFESYPGMSTGPLNNNEDDDLSALSRISDDESVNKSADGKSSIPNVPEKLSKSPSSDLIGKEASEIADKPSPINGKLVKMGKAPETNKHLPPGPEKIAEVGKAPETDNPLPPGDEKIAEGGKAPESDGNLAPVSEQDSPSEVGYFRKVWRKWFGRNSDGFEEQNLKDQEKHCTSDSGSQNKSHATLEKHFTSKITSVNGKDKERHSKSTPQFVVPEHPLSHSLAVSESAMDDRTTTSSEAHANKSDASPGFFTRVSTNWRKFWRGSSDCDKLSDLSSDEPNLTISHAGMNELFSKDSFWSSMESFMESPKGATLVSESKTREQMAQNLKHEGPSSLGSLGENDVLHLVDLLISEKKWVEQCPSDVLPFKLTRVGKSFSSDRPRGSNGLSSIFLGSSPNADVQRSTWRDGQEKSENVAPAECLPSNIIDKSPTKSQVEILADCENLLKEILKEHPGGYFVGLFRKLFRERYGYQLDLQKLGFQRLASLLQIMPGVKIESGYIIPYNDTPKIVTSENVAPDKQEKVSHKIASSDGDSSDALMDIGVDSEWEELGPVASSRFNKSKLGSVLRKKRAEAAGAHKVFDYEPAISDDDLSDSVETLSVAGSERQEKAGEAKEDSSLLHILDSWYSSKGGEHSKENSENLDLDNVSASTAKLSGSSLVEADSETSPRSYGRKQRPQKSYSFVSDPVKDDERLVDSLLGNMKKPNESSKKGGTKVLYE